MQQMQQGNDEDKNNMHSKGKKETIVYQLNPSSQLLFEDALKRCLNKYGGKKVPLKTPYAPRNHNSPFGDFPKSYLPKKNSDYNLINIESHQMANAVSNYPSAKRGNKKAISSTAFTSLTRATTDKPPKAGALQPRKITASDFRLHYDRGDLPVLVKHEKGTSIQWKDPTFDILDHVKDNIVKIIPQLILPLKTALNTRDVDIIAVALKVIQKLVMSSDLAGEALVPYYRQLLPIFNLYRNHNVNIGDYFEYGQRKKKCLGDLIQETLEKMELNGGDDAFINIKYMIPTYESCVYDIRG